MKINSQDIFRRKSPPVDTSELAPRQDNNIPRDAYVSGHRDKFQLGAAALALLSAVGVVTNTAVNILSEEVSTSEILTNVSEEYQVATRSDIEEATNWAVERSFSEVPGKLGESRHELGLSVRSLGQKMGEPEKTLYDGSDLVVIAFEGTGSFHPRKVEAFQAASKKLREQGLVVDGNQGSLADALSNSLECKEGRPSAWSGVVRGPLEQLVRNPETASRTQVFSFPSEEFEVLSSLEVFKNASPGELLGDSYESLKGKTPGVDHALKAVRDILSQAKEQGKEPKFIVLSHSSGGRSAVKFLEGARSIKNDQGESLKFSSVITIDPVREAHFALIEAGRELVNKGTEHNINRIRKALGLKPKDVYPPLVRSRSQPENLYKPNNAERFLNFYQKQDTEGLKMGPRFGIQGSPVRGALNKEIVDVGTAGHGEIATHPKVTEAFVAELRALQNSGR